MADSTDDVWMGLALRVGITAAIFTILRLRANCAGSGGVYVPAAQPVPRWMWSISDPHDRRVLFVGVAE